MYDILGWSRYSVVGVEVMGESENCRVHTQALGCSLKLWSMSVFGVVSDGCCALQSSYLFCGEVCIVDLHCA